MEVKEVRPGDAILWPKSGILAETLCKIIDWYDPKTWKPRTFKPWHVGFVVNVLEDGEAVTFQAVGHGVDAITYPNVQALVNEGCSFYRWLDNPDQAKIDAFVEHYHGQWYDALGYVPTIIGALSLKYLHWAFRLVDSWCFCWEVLRQFYNHMGKPIQWDEEPVMLNAMLNKLEL